MTPVGRWILVGTSAPVGEAYVSATVTAAGPLAGVTPGQRVMLRAALAVATSPEAYPREALVARLDADDATWHPEPGWSVLMPGTGGVWVVTSSRRFSTGAVYIREGAAVELSGSEWVVADVDVVATA